MTINSITKQYLLLTLVLIITYTYSIEFAPRIGNAQEDTLLGQVNKIHETFNIKWNSKLCRKLTGSRGKQYYIGTMTEEKKERLRYDFLTFWNFAHLMMYTVIGFICPDLFWEAMSISAGFEVYEYYVYDCADMMDILSNCAGFLIGRTMGFLYAY